MKDTNTSTFDFQQQRLLNVFENQIALELKLTFDGNLKNVKSANIEIYYQGQRKLQYTKFVRPHIDYGYILYNQACSDSFEEKLGWFDVNGA